MDTKTELHELIKAELDYVKENQAFLNLDEATENIATDIFTAEDWDNPNALESLKEDLNSLTVVDEDEAVEWIEFELIHSYGYDIENDCISDTYNIVGGFVGCAEFAKIITNQGTEQVEFDNNELSYNGVNAFDNEKIKFVNDNQKVKNHFIGIIDNLISDTINLL